MSAWKSSIRLFIPTMIGMAQYEVQARLTNKGTLAIYPWLR
jgi:hypothetical protein